MLTEEQALHTLKFALGLCALLKLLKLLIREGGKGGGSGHEEEG